MNAALQPVTKVAAPPTLASIHSSVLEQNSESLLAAILYVTLNSRSTGKSMYFCCFVTNNTTLLLTFMLFLVC